MSLTTVVHLNFRGDARDALGFYQGVFGGEPTIVTYADAHAAEDPADADRVMWGQVAAPGGFRVMAYDVQTAKAWSPGENAFYVALVGEDASEIERGWKGLAEDATILQPLGPAGWSPLYGMLKDRFGVVWIVSVMAAPQAA